MEPSEGSPRIARISCIPCRKSKRRCDKKIPSCDLCTKKEVDCSYPLRHSAAKAQAALLAASNSVRGPDTSSLDSLSFSGNGQGSPEPFSTSAESDVSAVYFLAPRLFQQSHLELPQPGLSITIDVSSLLGNASSVRDIAIKFFTTIHQWLPIISKQAFFSSLLNPIAQRRTEQRLLTLCMKLCCTEPGDDPRAGIYRIAKEFHHKAETYGPLSTQVLQAGILIAVYELGQSIYPAAYLTVGACARYGLALKIDHASVVSGVDAESPRPWNETEERKRVWWAVLILDRYLSLSNPSRALSSEDPTFDSYLPVDDTAWDEGTAKPGDVVTISTGFTLKTGNFARLAQATYLLSQTLRLISETVKENNVAHSNQVMQLRRTILSLVHAADREVEIRRIEFCAQSELCLRSVNSKL
ncbi:putative fungal-specific transcription factor [Dactylonectria macrodidyma]|uniref:Fungal-specific transcription factor n=1 Tax=Dactylonectria macrodidyma TaxID=307937 RepID=A0A9P9DMC4_9HYPO|nr:putative fungal-specific transcription factor [Dactylonectria macrodidyma]